MSKKDQSTVKQPLLSTVKGKFMLMGSTGIIIALIIGIIGITSINRNARSSEVVSLVNEISVLQSQNLANDALYQYYVDDSYLNASLDNLTNMEKKAAQLKEQAGATYASSVNSILENVAKDKTNYEELLQFHASRGYNTDIGKYQEFANASVDLDNSFQTLVNNNDWMEIPWIVETMGNGERVTVDGKEYNKLIYDRTLPVGGKRNNIVTRVGGTFTYQADYYVKNIYLVNGSDELYVDLSTVEKLEKSGDGLADASIVTFGGEPAIKVTGKYNAAMERWEEVATTFSVVDLDMENYPDLRYELYMDASAEEGQGFQYGGAISGVYGFSSALTNLDSLVQSYSKLVVEGKDVTGALGEIEALMAELETNIPKYTTDPALAEASLGFLNTKKALFEDLKAADAKTLTIKEENATINTTLTDLCAQVLVEAQKQMDAVRASVTVIIVLVLILGIIILLALLLTVSIGINKSVDSFKAAVDSIAEGNIATRADASGKDEFALFASSLNGFLDVLQETVTKVKNATDILSESGVSLEESARESKSVAANINETIHQISTGAVEQARDVETSSQQIIDIRENINQIFGSVTTLSEKSSEMGSLDATATGNMAQLTQSSDKTTEAFDKIVEQVRKTDASVSQIQDAISLIASVANQINLLSLNASIEAARAGDAGKGFAVVASEISSLADQTNKSAAIINGIIKSLSEESNRTVETISSAADLIQEQKNAIDSTGEIFSNVSDGIEYTSSSVDEVLRQSKACEDASQTVVGLMTNLSAISEENAASAETTSESMAKLNQETARLADTAAELKKIADVLQEDLAFFKV